MPETIIFADQDPTTGFAAEHLRRPYDLYAISVNYLGVEGNLQVPVASAEDVPSEIVKVASRWTMKIVRWAARRLGETPQIPDPTPVNEQEVLILRSIVPQSPIPQPDGVTRMYLVTGEYRYAITTPLGNTVPLSMGKVAYDNGAKENHVLTQDRYSRDLI